MERTILHCDLNNFYASCECMLDKNLRDKPVAVCGSVEERHGIVLAKNYHAKRYGVSTAEPVWQAKAKCPELVIVPPHFDVYVKYSRIVKAIYTHYTDRVESFGLDECWLDISIKKISEKEGIAIANEIRERVKRETGLTISVGVSFNKVFAKLGSDMKKPDAVTAIGRNDFKEKIWDLPAEYLFGVGRKTKAILDKYYINTIGKIAVMPCEFFESHLGKFGTKLWQYANGDDPSPVLETAEYIPAKSFGHGTTPKKDIENAEEVWNMLLYLSQDVGQNLRLNRQRASGVSVTIRDSKLSCRSWQGKLPMPTRSAFNIAKTAFDLFTRSYKWENPIRSVTVSAINLVPAELPVQIELFDDLKDFERAELVEDCANSIRDRFGRNAIVPAALLSRDLGGNHPPAFSHK